MNVVTNCPAKLLAVVVLSVHAWGLNPKLALTQYGHDIWTTSNGLPHDSIRAIAQTTDGYLWFGTVDGLARFDGVNFTVFNGANTPLLKQSTITAVLAAPDGSLWIGTTNNGLLLYRHGAFEKMAVPGLPGASIRALMVDSRGVLWLGADKGLTRLDRGRASTVFTGGYESNVHALLEYPAGTVWAGANDGLHRFEGGGERVFTTKDGLPDNSIWGMAASAGGGLWVGTHAGGLSEYRQGRFRAYDGRDGSSLTSTTALVADRDGAVWIGTDGVGLYRLAEGKLTSYQTRDAGNSHSGSVRALFASPKVIIRALQPGGPMPLRRRRRQPVDWNRRWRDQPLQGIPRDHPHHARRTAERRHTLRPGGPFRRPVAGDERWDRPHTGLGRDCGIRHQGRPGEPADVPGHPGSSKQLVGRLRIGSSANVPRGTARQGTARVEIQASAPPAVRATGWHDMGHHGGKPCPHPRRLADGFGRGGGFGLGAGDSPGGGS